ncbi:ribosomal protein S18-alanine N-acetyltransferase [Kamptonema formosum]|uniref:ribosomal protein S18-alanine N-acetyltransferase n=1 Tax=Kamptonema formosum TaxID=331992 RepID=UPI0003684926|nr:ribosomal protein S18-alanine N-acetyltransferase [Oscillatoria sp. PCC 10802]
MNFLDLKPLTSQLLPSVLDLDRLCFGGLWTLEGYQRELASPNSDLLALSIPPQNRLEGGESERLVGIGCLWAILDEAHIILLGIHPDFQQQGLGQAMLAALLGTAAQRHLERATLEARISNRAALGLYQKLGFREAGRRRNYYQDTNEDAVIMWRPGLQHPEFGPRLASWQRESGLRLASAGWHLDLSYQRSPE